MIMFHCQVGTTAEVLALRDEYMDAQFWNIPCLVVKFLGRQRFRLLNLFRKANGCVFLSVCSWVCLRV